MGWKIEKQANGKFAIYSTRLDDYIVIDAEPLHIAQIYAEKGVKVYLASARMQLDRQTPVPDAGEAKIEVSRRRGSTPKERPDLSSNSSSTVNGTVTTMKKPPLGVFQETPSHRPKRVSRPRRTCARLR